MNVTIISFLIIFSFELALHLLSFFLEEYTSFQKFLITASRESNLELDKNSRHIFFVGDSFTYGVGASSPNFSYPSQLCKLLNQNQQKRWTCHNFGYPGSNTQDHIEVLKILPENSKVILRTGANNSWNTRKLYTIDFWGLNFEVKLIKLALVIFGNKAIDKPADHHEIKQFIHNVAQDKNLDLRYLSYPKEFQPALFVGNNFELLNHPDYIELHGKLLEGGHLEGSFLKPDLLSSDGIHPNDLGYLVDARLILESLVERSDFGLNSDQYASDSGSLQKKLVKNHQQKLDELLSTLRSFQLYNRKQPSFLATKKQIERNRTAVKLLMKVQSLAHLLSAQGETHLKKIKNSSARLLLLLFHKTGEYSLIQNAIQNRKKDQMEVPKLALELYKIYSAISDSSSREVSVHLTHIEKSLETDGIEIPYGLTNLQRPYPLSFCQNLKEHFDIKELNLDVSQDFQLIFGKPLPKLNDFFIPYNCKDPDF